jgi:general secretion pathway protein G
MVLKIMRQKLKNKGFTLLEILVVIVLLGILATIVLGSYTSSLERSRDSRRKQDLAQVSHALELYYSENNSYPDSLEWGESLTYNGILYMKQLPQDPSSPGYTYQYEVSENNQEFQLYCCLENTQDPEYADYSNNCGTSCGGQCRYGIASPNSTP